MELMQAILNRRSVRKYSDAPVADKDIHRMLEAAMMAPSAGNAQPWQFVVIRDRTKLETIPQIHPYAKMAADAPLGIMVCGDLTLEKFEGFWVQDCSAAVQNILLAAHGLGLGAVWTGIYPVQDRVDGFRKLCGLPEKVIPLALLVMGYPAQETKSESRYKAKRVHSDQW
jgi:nitroreductase